MRPILCPVGVVYDRATPDISVFQGLSKRMA